jgi:TATA-box binding protein (TBP) (component of TFIID and TFIIIB)
MMLLGDVWPDNTAYEEGEGLPPFFLEIPVVSSYERKQMSNPHKLPPRRWATADELVEQLDRHMAFLVDEDQRIHVRHEVLPGTTIMASMNRQNTTITSYNACCDAVRATMTTHDPEGALLDPAQRVILCAAYNHSINTGSCLDTSQVLSLIASANNDKCKFPATHVPFEVSLQTGSMFESFTTVVSGARTTDRMWLGMHNVRVIKTQLRSYATGLPKIIVFGTDAITQNIVVSVTAGHGIHSTKLVSRYPRVAKYAPSNFVAVVFNIVGVIDPNTGREIAPATALIFASGSIIVIGLQCPWEVDPVMRYILEVVAPFERNVNETNAKKRHDERTRDEYRMYMLALS